MKSVMEWQIKMETQLPIFSAYDRDGEASLTQMFPSTVAGRNAAPWGFHEFFFSPLAVRAAYSLLPAALG